MTLYASMGIGGGTNPGSYAETTTAQFTGSFVQTIAASNQVQLGSNHSNFAGSRFESTTAQFTGSLFATLNPAGSNAIYNSGAVNTVNGSEFATSGTDFDGTFYNTERSGGTIINTTTSAGSGMSAISGTATTTDDNWGSTSFLSQSFKCTVTGSARGMSYRITKGGLYSAAGSMLVFGLASNPSGAFLTSGVHNGDGYVGTANRDLPFSAGYPLVSGTEYYWRWEQAVYGAGDLANQWLFGEDRTAPVSLSGWFNSASAGWTNLTDLANFAWSDWIIYGDSGTAPFNTVGSYLHLFAVAGSYWDIGSLIWHSTSGASEIVQAQVRTAGSNAAFGTFSSYTAGSVIVLGSTNIGSVEMMFQLSGPTTSSPLLDDLNLGWSVGAATFVNAGSYEQTFAVGNGSFYNVGSLIWNATSGASQLVTAQYRLAGSNAAFGAYSSFSAGSVTVINGSNIGSVGVLFLLSGPSTSTPSLDNWQVDFNDVEQYFTNGSYVVTRDLSGTSSTTKNIDGFIWHSGGTGPLSVDYRFSNNLSTFTSYTNDTTGSVDLSNITYRYIQLRFNLSGNGAVL